VLPGVPAAAATCLDGVFCCAEVVAAALQAGPLLAAGVLNLVADICTAHVGLHGCCCRTEAIKCGSAAWKNCPSPVRPLFSHLVNHCLEQLCSIVLHAWGHAATQAADVPGDALNTDAAVGRGCAKGLQ